MNVIKVNNDGTGTTTYSVEDFTDSGFVRRYQGGWGGRIRWEGGFIDADGAEYNINDYSTRTEAEAYVVAGFNDPGSVYEF